MGSPRLNGGTAELCKPFIKHLKQKCVHVDYIELHNKNISPCLGCMQCQNIAHEYGCGQQDDMQFIIESVLQADALVYATPIYSWQATPPTKTVMDRMFGLNKFYGSAPKGSLFTPKTIALIATCGYEPEYGADLLDEVVRRLCKHSGVSYSGMFAVRDGAVGDLMTFQTNEVIFGIQEFADKILNEVERGAI